MIEPSVAPPLVPAASAAPTPPTAQPNPTWWVNRKGLPMTRHTRHKTKTTKTACNLGLSRFRPATDEETQHLGVCSFCVPAGKARR